MNFSVIIPVYNVAPYLSACLDSVCRACAGYNAEIICVDDGSTDGSGQALDEYASRFDTNREFPTIRVIHRVNAGVSAARNAGLEIACGEWILFIDSDDVVRETLIRTVAEAVATCQEADMVAYGVTVFENSPEWGTNREALRVLDLRYEIPSCMAEKSLWSMAYRHKIISSVRFRPFHFGEDLIFACEAMVRSSWCVVLNRPEYAYRRRLGSAMQMEWTTARMVETIAFCPTMFEVLSRSGKVIGDGFVRGRGDEWLLRIPLLIGRNSGRVDVALAWKIWFSSVGAAPSLFFATTSQRLVAIVARLRIRWLVIVFCRVAIKVASFKRR